MFRLINHSFPQNLRNYFFKITAHHITKFLAILTVFAVSSAYSKNVVINVNEAASHFGETVVVRGQVREVKTMGPGMVFLNFGKPHPNAVFVVVVQPDVAANNNWQQFQGKDVEVMGRIELRKGHPQITLRDTNSIQMFGDSKFATSNQPVAQEISKPVTVTSQKEEETSEPELNFGNTESPQGARQITQFKVPLTAEEKKLAGKSSKGLQPAEATVGLMIPQDFDASKPHKVFVVFATDDGGGAHVNTLSRFGYIVNEASWLAVAANGPVLEENLSAEWHAAMILAGLRAAEEKFPGFKTWEFYVGGNSGGALRSSMMACALLAKNYNVKGVFMGAAGAERFSTGIATFRASRAAVRKLAVFFSHGNNDHVVSSRTSDAVAKMIQGLGIRNLRRDSYEGEHGMNDESLRKALVWFIDPSKK